MKNIMRHVVFVLMTMYWGINSESSHVVMHITKSALILGYLKISEFVLSVERKCLQVERFLQVTLKVRLRMKEDLCWEDITGLSHEVEYRIIKLSPLYDEHEY